MQIIILIGVLAAIAIYVADKNEKNKKKIQQHITNGDIIPEELND